MSVAEKMTAIADAIRNKTGKTDKLSLDEMATEINEISSGERDINPEWTDWNYFCSGRPDLVAKLKYTDTSNGTNFSYMFNNCRNLDSIPELDTSNGKTFNYTFSNCQKITSIPPLNTSKGTSLSGLFNGCYSLVSVPPLDTSNCSAFGSMFSYCEVLSSIPPINMSKASSFTSMFAYCYALVDLSIVGTINKTGLDISYSTLLSHDSLMSIINALADKTGVSGTFKVTLGSTNLAKLTADEIAIAEGKGWTLA